MSVQLARRRFTTGDYNRMIEVGLLGKDDRVELIDGEIIEMSPIGTRHAACVDRLNALFHALSSGLIVRVQSPIQIDPDSEPQPDLSLLRARADFYDSAHPTAADVLLVVEVSDTTYEKDRGVKMPLYARAGIPEAWLVDLYDDRVEIHSDPAGGIYQRSRIVQRNQNVQSEVLPQLTLTADEILG
jgi:Uma2 family endonuclease